MHRILIFLSLIILSSQAVSDATIMPNYGGGYSVYDQPRYGTNPSLHRQQMMDFMNRPSISEQSNQRNLNNAYKLQQIRQLKHQNDLMKQQLESQRQLQEMQRENELLQRELEGNSREHYSEGKIESSRYQSNPQKQPSSGKRVRVKQSIIGLYSEPFNQSEKVDRLKKDTRLTVVEEKDEWIKVETKSGDQGWVMRSMVR